MKNFITGFMVAAILFTGFGYWWSWKALTKTYQLRLEQKQLIIDHYRSHWTPIRTGPVRQRVK